MSSVQEIIDPLATVVISLVDQKYIVRDIMVMKPSDANLGLCNLVVMMRECEIDPTRMYIHIIA